TRLRKLSGGGTAVSFAGQGKPPRKIDLSKTKRDFEKLQSDLMKEVTYQTGLYRRVSRDYARGWAQAMEDLAGYDIDRGKIAKPLADLWQALRHRDFAMQNALLLDVAMQAL